jgi:hypothetical protein
VAVLGADSLRCFFGADRGLAFRLARFHARCSAAARLRRRRASRFASLNCLRARFSRSLARRSCCFATWERNWALAADSSDTAAVAGSVEASSCFLVMLLSAEGEPSRSLTQSATGCHRAARAASYPQNLWISLCVD